MPSPTLTSWFNRLSVVLVLLGLFLALKGPLLYAQEEDSPQSSPQSSTETASNSICIVEIADEVATYDADMMNFLQQHYLSEVPASELSETAWIKFKEYRQNMRQLVGDYLVGQSGKFSEKSSKEADACKQFVEDHIFTIQLMLKNHNLSNAGGKTSYSLVTQLKTINKGLQKLNEQFGQLFGEFKTFSDKLPGTTP